MTRQTKSVQRLYVDEPLVADSTLILTGNPAHYLRNVLRADADYGVLLFNGVDGEWHARITQINKREVSLTIDHRTRLQDSQADIWLLVAPVKRARLDYLAQKATEMGVSRLVPIMTERSQGGSLNADRLRANAQEAAEQCGILNVPDIVPAQRLDAVLDGWDPARKLIFCDEAAPTGAGLLALSKHIDTRAGALAVLIGPEGGFSESEREAVLGQPATLQLSLGPRILRTDTAVVAALTLVQWAAGDWQSDS